jgi:eukaryotic-like serine/threonine-protein kinase
MHLTPIGSQGIDVDVYIRAFEAAWDSGEPDDLGAFLPEDGDPLRDKVLVEIVRVDLELRWTRGRPRPLADYQSSFPQLFRDRVSLSEVAFEEYRLRRLRGEDVTPNEYAIRYGAEVESWPALTQDEASECSDRASRTWIFSRPPGSRAAPLLRANPARADSASGPESEQPRRSKTIPWERTDESPERNKRVVKRDRPDRRTGKSRVLARLPTVGSEFIGFQLLAELGAGSFGRVYLASQEDLADRHVVLKIAPHLFDEPQTLAQLQHNHIVPIYSVHERDDFQAVCMPFLGTTTLADVVADLKVRAAMPDSGSYIFELINTRSLATANVRRFLNPETGTAGRTGLGPPPAPANYVDKILWLAVRIADGLAHAHSRGILHRDLKPANILLTDDGQPMLLDFNLSEDTKRDPTMAPARVGGTLRYMAPEQLVAIKKGILIGDQRSDLYSFGLILHELLTGHHPDYLRFGPIPVWLHDRRTECIGPPEVRRWNKAVSPGTESIVRHCLEPDPSRRYQTAHELHEDLRRQAEHLPLRFAAEPSLRESARKWTRRHPRLISSTVVGAFAALLLITLGSIYFLRVSGLNHERIAQQLERARTDAVFAHHRLHNDLKTIEFLLGSDVPGSENEQRQEGMALARTAIDRYEVLGPRDWQAASRLSKLTPEQRKQVLDDMGEILLLLAGAIAPAIDGDFALRLNDLASGCYPANAVPRAVLTQRIAIARSASRNDIADRLLSVADKAPATSPRDRYLLLLTEYRQRGRLPEALPWLTEASRQQKDNCSVWLVLGNCYAALGNRNDAIACYDMAIPLWPEGHWTWHYRGLACLEEGDDLSALRAFDEVIRLRPEFMQAYFNRALAKYHLQDLAGARADLTVMLAGPKPPLRAFFLRAKVHAKQGDTLGARRDQEDGMRGEPLDECDLTARGLVRQRRDPRGALADYELALKRNPRYIAALQNKANVLAEDLGQTEAAVAALDMLLGLRPTYVPAIAGRGVLLARLGHRDRALADARDALPRDKKPFNTYQVAGIFALTSRQNPDDRREAMSLLESALNQGFGLDLIDKDRDLDPIRDQPEFQRLVDRARARKSNTASSSARKHAAVKSLDRPAKRPGGDGTSG